MKRSLYLERVISAYLHPPDTPRKARPLDWAVASSFYKRRLPLATVKHAIRLATLRRRFREQGLEPLETVRSLAYYRPLVQQIHDQPHDPGYITYIAENYRRNTTG